MAKDRRTKASDLKRAINEDGALKTHVGGQALIEGVMMRGKYNWAVAVREPSGKVYVEEHDLASGKKKFSWLTWPVIRGCTAFVESLALGAKALTIAAEHAFTEEANEETGEEGFEFGGGALAVSMVLGLVLGVALFIVAPAFVTNLLVGEYDDQTLLWNVVDGILRVIIFIFYIWLIGRMEDISRMFEYHGAEHKTIHCFEHGLPLTPENARQFPCLHVRCGTAFLITVMLIAIFVYAITPINALIDAWGVHDSLPKLGLVMLVRLLMMPLIAGLSYEVTVKWAGSRPEHPLVRIVLWPGLQMQRLTTHEPDDEQLECAILAMSMVLEREEREKLDEKTDANSTGSGSNDQTLGEGADGQARADASAA